MKEKLYQVKKLILISQKLDDGIQEYIDKQDEPVSKSAAIRQLLSTALRVEADRK